MPRLVPRRRLLIFLVCIGDVGRYMVDSGQHSPDKMRRRDGAAPIVGSVDRSFIQRTLQLGTGAVDQQHGEIRYSNIRRSHLPLQVMANDLLCILGVGSVYDDLAVKTSAAQ